VDAARRVAYTQAMPKHASERRCSTGALPLRPPAQAGPLRSESKAFTRRRALRLAAASVAAPFILRAAEKSATPNGAISGEPTAEKVGAQVLAEGGNVVDAIVTAAFTAAVASPAMTGIGGYGGSFIFASADGKRVTAIDFNSTAPAAARPDMFAPDEKGAVRGGIHMYGWLAAGVPGIPAGLELALKRFGTRSFRDAVLPAAKLARDGFKLPAALANSIKGSMAQFGKDPGSRKLFTRDGTPLTAGEVYRNPDVAALLDTLAQRNSADSFYRGDLALRFAEAFAKHGGLVTAQDMAAYQAREAEPLRLAWNGADIRTAPLTAGGLTVLQALATLRALEWDRQPESIARTHARIEALRVAWADRLALLGDPEHAKVPIAKLLSGEYANETADKIRRVVKEGKTIPLKAESRAQPGTINLSAVDKQGNLAALTLTHGGGFGARVTVDGLGLTLGHGMSRFDPQPGHPNCPGPGKRPLHNMVPTIVLRGGRPLLAIGGRGGRKIPNALFEVLTHYVALGQPWEAALAAPRLHTEGNESVEFESKWPAAEVEALAKLGYKTKTAGSATMSAAAFNPGTGEGRAALR
jgi:gamma-glutamyltranspeptidase / glutathione hydrolase